MKYDQIFSKFSLSRSYLFLSDYTLIFLQSCRKFLVWKLHNTYLFFEKMNDFFSAELWYSIALFLMPGNRFFLFILTDRTFLLFFFVICVFPVVFFVLHPQISLYTYSLFITMVINYDNIWLDTVHLPCCFISLIIIPESMSCLTLQLYQHNICAEHHCS